MPSVLVIDGDASHHALCETAAHALGFQPQVHSADQLDASRKELFDVAAVVLCEPATAALAVPLLEQIVSHHARVPLVAIVARPAAAIEASRAGAAEVLFAPVSTSELQATLERVIQLRGQMQTTLAVRDTSELVGGSAGPLIGRSPVMQQLFKRIGLASAHDVPLLITGESGTGKRTIARVIHDYSRQKQQAFSIIHCGAETRLDGQLDPELSKRAGSARQPASAAPKLGPGTCVLAGIEQLSLAAQQPLLRLLRHWQDNGAGDHAPEASATRLIATSEVDFSRLVADSALAAELVYELGRFTLTAPPLRERLDDLPLLTDHFVKLWSRRLGKRVYQHSPAMIELLRAYHWPGNLRELSSVVCQAVVTAKGATLTVDDVAEFVQQASATQLPDDDLTIDCRRLVDEQIAAKTNGIYAAALEAVDQRLLKIVLQRTAGNQARAARALGMTRGRLRQKLRERGIVIDRLIDVYDQSTQSPRSAATSN